MYCSDSKVVLGYIQNESRRFYVANRVQLIRISTAPNQWRYIGTARNPADLATRCVTKEKQVESPWIRGPEFLWNPQLQPHASLLEVPLSKSDPEVKRKVIICATAAHSPQSFGCERFKRFSSWSVLRHAIPSLIAFIRKFKERNEALSNKPEIPRPPPSAAELEQAGLVVIKAVQKKVFPAELKVLLSPNIEKSVPKHSNLLQLDPLLDSNGLLRVGGRLENSTLEYQEKHPVILRKGHRVLELIIRHFHENVHHQGRLITSGAVREVGYWVVGAHRMISSLIESCVNCEKLRGATLTQHRQIYHQTERKPVRSSQMSASMSLAPGKPR